MFPSLCICPSLRWYFSFSLLSFSDFSWFFLFPFFCNFFHFSPDFLLTPSSFFFCSLLRFIFVLLFIFLLLLLWFPPPPFIFLLSFSPFFLLPCPWFFFFLLPLVFLLLFFFPSPHLFFTPFSLLPLWFFFFHFCDWTRKLIYQLICVLSKSYWVISSIVCTYPAPPPWAGFNPVIFLKPSTAGWNSFFLFLQLVSLLQKAVNHTMMYHFYWIPVKFIHI